MRQNCVLILSVFIVLSLGVSRLCAQGCSDAGLCSISGQVPVVVSAKRMYANSLLLSTSLAQGEGKTRLVVSDIEYRHFFSNNSFVSVKLPFYAAFGKLGNYSGFGDPVISFAHSVPVSDGFVVSGTLGLRVGTGRANSTDDQGLPLPMVYQRSLGTTDLVVGIDANVGKYLSFTAGYQQPLVQYNDNGYLGGGSQGNEYGTYFPSKGLRRRSDLLLRAEAHFATGPLSLSAGPLAIYHLGRDKAEQGDGSLYAIQDSQGLTLNMSAKGEYRFGRFALKALAAAPFLVRANRPDGLTRSWILSFGASCQF